MNLDVYGFNFIVSNIFLHAVVHHKARPLILIGFALVCIRLYFKAVANSIGPFSVSTIKFFGLFTILLLDF